MAKMVVSKIRLFPLLIVFALFALVSRGVDLYTGISLLGSVAVAQNADDPKNDGADDEAASKPAATAAAPPGFYDPPSREEEDILLNLKARREALINRENQLDLQANLLSSTEARMDQKIKRLEELETKIKGHLRLFDEREDLQLKSVVAVYEKMKAKDAAPRFEILPPQIQLDLATRMKPAKVAAIMAKMQPLKAKELTQQLATKAAPPSIEDVQGGK
ncbi:MAG: hypothetical protein JKY60_10560 [Kordiimonadaceae bacterium]|nr:hypothetical protein [Kordiimonadaceae bacterium]